MARLHGNAIEDFKAKDRAMYEDALKFHRMKMRSLEQPATAPLDAPWIAQMVQQDLDELREATSEAEQVHMLLNSVHYMLTSLAATGLPIPQLWEVLHASNMAKFEIPGGHFEDGQWVPAPEWESPHAELQRMIQASKPQEPILEDA